MQLLSQQETRQLEMEMKRQRLQSLQQEQLEHTEMVLQQQRHYLNDAQQRSELGDTAACNDVLVHGGCGGGGRQQAMPLGGGCFSAEI
jgi:hypothetical protein